MRGARDIPEILSIDELLAKKLIIPDYQRPYKWTAKNITELILDIQKSIEESRKYTNFKYRVGTIILYKNENNEYEIVDGQQRILSFLLLKLCLKPDFTCSLLNKKFSHKVTQKNLHDNNMTIQEWFSSDDAEHKKVFNRALKDILEVVVITVYKISEAFQLFDSQNTRGRALYPHDLLKAYHLREIHNKNKMQAAVVKWEANKPDEIRELFDLYLYPLWNWTKRRKCGIFTTAEIDIYKGIEKETGYTYACRADKAQPYFLITEPFISGGDFFLMVGHYMQMLHKVKEEIVVNPKLNGIKKILAEDEEIGSVELLDKKLHKSLSTGLKYAWNLFFCALLCYYDRFHNFDVLAVKKLFTWSMMVRVDMEHLGFDTINLYAIGDDNDRYSNKMAVIEKIAYARKHAEISGMKLEMREDNKAASKNWDKLYIQLRQLNENK